MVDSESAYRRRHSMTIARGRRPDGLRLHLFTYDMVTFQLRFVSHRIPPIQSTMDNSGDWAPDKNEGIHGARFDRDKHALCRAAQRAGQQAQAAQCAAAARNLLAYTHDPEV